MEVDPPSSENYHHGGGRSISSDQHVRTQTQVVKFYDCSFCKRGFSNAQALGGHMNIHRRERAKLKEPSTIINKKEKAGSSLVLDSSENKVCTQRQFRLFLETPPHSKKYKSRIDERETQMIVEGYKELDLELRLGLES